LDDSPQDVKVVFFNRFFFPDTSATSQIVSDLAFHLASAGHEVHAVTSRVPGCEALLEKVRGVSIHRVATAVTGPHSLFRRAAAYAQYYMGARSAARRLIEPGDVVILKTDPPLLSAAVGPLAKHHGAKVVLWLQDVFPEVAHEYGVPGMGGPIGAALHRIRNRSLAIADRVVVIGERMGDHLVGSHSVARDRLHVIHNWADGTAITPLSPADNPLRRAWNLENEFVVGYSGNLGRVHEFETMLEAAKLLKGESQVRFLIIGRGPRLEEVQARVKREDISNVRFETHQDRGSLAQSLGVADVHLSVLRPEFEGLVHPSKLYGIMAAGRPTLFVGDLSGETASILADTKSGLSVKTGDAQGLAAAILSLREQAEERANMGMRARQAFDQRFSMTIAIGKWEALLRSLS
jgi:colanic acid biosynthesis glycosyl transferase WcaI